MFQMTPVEREPPELGAVLADLVERFGRATNISSKLVSTVDEAPLSAHTKRELARIVQEALVNVRKHSGARQVLVSVSTDGAHCQLIVDDDGTGFDFEGRLSEEQLERQGKGPRIIRERVRLLGGSLAVVSRQNAGSRLEISVPLNK